MISEADLNNFQFICEQLENVHYPAGPIYQRTQRFKAQHYLKKDELLGIYCLIESHSPGLRLKATLRFDKKLEMKDESVKEDIPMSLNKDFFNLKCSNQDVYEAVDDLTAKIEELPKEWTIIQLTPQFNADENIESDPDKHYTNALHLSVIDCGRNAAIPFCVDINAPIDAVEGSIINLKHEMCDIIKCNNNQLSNLTKEVFIDYKERQNYRSGRIGLDDRLKGVVKDMEKYWLGFWRCLLTGKFVNEALEKDLETKILDFILLKKPYEVLRDKNVKILVCLAKSAEMLYMFPLKQALISLFPQKEDKKFRLDLYHFLEQLHDDLKLSEQKRYPVILVLDDSLDIFPWEQMDICQNHPISRVPSFHIVYALYKEHKDTILQGYKMVESRENSCSYIINPGLDLKEMEVRLSNFSKYWLPTWKVMAGERPSETEFEEMLTKNDIFMYSGHGDATSYFSNEKIERSRVKAVVCLFGCGSTRMRMLNHQVELYGISQTYFTACCPCFIGMLWNVTDLDTDRLTTEFVSLWIPSEAPIHWRHINKKGWVKGESIDSKTQEESQNMSSRFHEPDLLSALSQTKKSNAVSYYTTKAAFVARGIPVKLKSSDEI